MTTKYFSRVTLCCALLLALVFYACSKKNSNTGGGTGNGTFSVTVNGKIVTGSGGPLNNADIVIAADPSSQFDSAGDIFVSMTGQGDTIGVHLPDRSGWMDVGDTSSIATSYGVLRLPDTVYVFAPVHFNVTTLTQTRIVGTFSGTASTSLLPGGQIVTLTNGTFDLPILPH